MHADEKVDRETTTLRLTEASQRMHELLWRHSLYDACIVALWSLMLLAPALAKNGAFALGSTSRFVVGVLCVPSALTPLLCSALRVMCVLSTRRDLLRVDMIYGAPTRARQVAYCAYHEQIGWWMWLGYAGAALTVAINGAIAFVWMLVFGFAGHWILLGVIASMSGMSAASCFTSTKTLYATGVEENFRERLQGDALRWARYKAAQHAKSWSYVNGKNKNTATSV
jgi:hypothetical protein